jgi:dihydroorotase-like cyclic amidohydrolase
VVARAHAEGIPLTAETCPHFLEFTMEDLEAQGSLLKTAPVVKTTWDRDRLWEGLRTGDVEFVATDHAAGQWPEEKHSGSAWTDYGGVPGVELLLPYLYSEGVRKGRIDLQRLTEITASAPARFFGIDGRKGTIAPGYDADFAGLDEDAVWTVRAEALHNLNRYTPMDGRALTGRIRATIVRGTIVYRQDPEGTETWGKPGHGEWVRRERRVEA